MFPTHVEGGHNSDRKGTHADFKTEGTPTMPARYPFAMQTEIVPQNWDKTTLTPNAECRCWVLVVAIVTVTEGGETASVRNSIVTIRIHRTGVAQLS